VKITLRGRRCLIRAATSAIGPLLAPRMRANISGWSAMSAAMPAPGSLARSGSPASCSFTL
jgi:hypothetical protein